MLLIKLFLLYAQFFLVPDRPPPTFAHVNTSLSYPPIVWTTPHATGTALWLKT